MHSLLVFPLKHQIPIEEFFKDLATDYTKHLFGIELKKIWNDAFDIVASGSSPSVSFSVVPWSISVRPQRKHFADMYKKRLSTPKYDSA